MQNYKISFERRSLTRLNSIKNDFFCRLFVLFSVTDKLSRLRIFVFQLFATTFMPLYKANLRKFRYLCNYKKLNPIA